MTPRTTGTLGMVAATIVIVWCGVLIATPPFSILGALGLVAGAILFAISASQTVRKSWGRSSWPETKVRVPVVQLESTRQLIASSLSAGGVGYAAVGVWRVIAGDPEGWERIASGLVLAALAFLALIWVIKKERLKDERAGAVRVDPPASRTAVDATESDPSLSTDQPPNHPA